MSAISAGGLESETPAANLPHGSPSILESPPVTYPLKSLSNISTPAAGLKDKRWQPCQGILFGPARTAPGNGIPTVGDGQSQGFSTIARQCQSTASLPTRPPPARPQQPGFKPYAPTKYEPVKLFMSEEDDDDSFGVDDEELGDILAQCQSCEEASDAHSPAEIQTAQISQQAVEPQILRKDPGRIKPPLTLTTPSRKPQVKTSPSMQITGRQPPIDTNMSEARSADPRSQAITRIKALLTLKTPARNPKVEHSPSKQTTGRKPPINTSMSKHNSAEPRSQVATANSSTSPASSPISQIVPSLSGDSNKVTIPSGFPTFAPYNIRNPYPHDWAAHKKAEPLISEDYLLSSEISRLAQLPRPIYTDVVTPNVDGKMTLETMIMILSNVRNHGQRTFDRIDNIIDDLIHDIRNAKAGSSYKPLFNRLELLEMHDEILDRWTSITRGIHHARTVMLARRDAETSLDSGLECMEARETSLILLQSFQATYPINNVLDSRRDLFMVWRTLEKFYLRRQMVGLLRRATTTKERKINPAILIVRIKTFARLTNTFRADFPEAIAYKQLIQEQYIANTCVQSAIRANSSLQKLSLVLHDYKIARAECDRAGCSPLKRLIIKPAFHQSFGLLQAKIWDFTRYRRTRTMNGKEIRASLQDQGDNQSSTPQFLVAKSCEEANKDAVLQPRMVTFLAARSINDQASGGHAADISPRNDTSSNSATKRTPRTPLADKGSRKRHRWRLKISNPKRIHELPNSHKQKATLPSGASSISAMRTSRSTTHAGIRSAGEKTPKEQKKNIQITRRHYSNEACRLPPDYPATSPMLHNFGPTPQTPTNLPSQYCDAIGSIDVQQTSEDVSQITQVETISPDEGHSKPATRFPSSEGLKGFSMSRIRDETVSNEDSNLQPIYWSYDLYAGPNNEKVKVHYCKNKVDTERVAQMFKDEKVIGFDIEWKANSQAKDGVKKNVSLIQIASEDRVALFHIARFRENESLDSLVAPTFKAIMESPHITKVGVSIKGDCTRLRRFMGIESKGLFELSHLYNLVKYSNGDAGCINKRLVRLASQVEEHLGLPLWKGDARTSDWSLDLDLKQVQYAASDSYAGFQLFHTLEHKRKQLNPTPPRPYHAELNLPIRLTTGVSIETDDELEDSEDDPSMTAQPGEPRSTEELSRGFYKIKLAAPTLPTTTPPKRAPRPVAQPYRPEVISANEWVANWRNTLPQDYKPTAAPACLRAHALWHEQGFTVPEAAALLRDPPLLDATVATYVLDALKAEKLPFERHRLAAVISHVPQTMRPRYKRFIEKIGMDDI